MARTVAAGSVVTSSNVPGKRLGVKKYEGEMVRSGNIILRQRGSVFHPGKNTYMSKDFTIHANTNGKVKFRKMSGYKRGQYYVDVVESV
ncbi:50S ribosomal protein L27 [Candidatus Dojkabacteria bacterium]|uniref:Large ribosomal subunit protein bL27 n=1 Tax=Candidatus Dojkabacteria bacterium TaxID=2099670 RepID=A0A847VD50_9BACT|nr:50S ribosomal protein L27 [Candidatus Dojkabacteria bacterium]